MMMMMMTNFHMTSLPSSLPLKGTTTKSFKCFCPETSPSTNHTGLVFYSLLVSKYVIKFCVVIKFCGVIKFCAIATLYAVIKFYILYFLYRICCNYTKLLLWFNGMLLAVRWKVFINLMRINAIKIFTWYNGMWYILNQFFDNLFEWSISQITRHKAHTTEKFYWTLLLS